MFSLGPALDLQSEARASENHSCAKRSSKREIGTEIQIPRNTMAANNYRNEKGKEQPLISGSSNFCSILFSLYLQILTQEFGGEKRIRKGRSFLWI